MSGSFSSNNDFNTGNDVRLVLIADAPIGRVDMNYVTDFSCAQKTKDVEVKRLDGTPLNKDIPGGWAGSFSLDRASSVADDTISLMEQMYWGGQRLPNAQLYQYISEVNGSTSTYLFTDVTFSFANAGTWQQETAVKQSIKFQAGRRRRV